MSTETKTAAPSDEQLGAALRKIAEAIGQTQDGFAYYVKQIDGVLEHAVEMLAGHNVPGSISDAFGDGSDRHGEIFEKLRSDVAKYRELLETEIQRRVDAEQDLRAGRDAEIERGAHLAAEVERLTAEAAASKRESRREVMKLRTILAAETDRRAKAESDLSVAEKEHSASLDQLARAIGRDAEVLEKTREERRQAEEAASESKAKYDRLVSVFREALCL
jgi:hypothetical protein